MVLVNHQEKKRFKKFSKTVKLPAVNKNQLSRKSIFVQTSFSHSNTVDKNHAGKALAFSIDLLFRHGQK